MKKTTFAVLLVIAATFLTSTAQILLKFGINNLNLNFIGLITNYLLIIGLFIYVIAGFMLIVALKHHELSVLYPIIATSYIWVAILSPLFFPTDKITLLKIIAIFIIILGVSFVGFGGKND